MLQNISAMRKGGEQINLQNKIFRHIRLKSSVLQETLQAEKLLSVEEDFNDMRNALVFCPEHVKEIMNVLLRMEMQNGAQDPKQTNATHTSKSKNVLLDYCRNTHVSYKCKLCSI